VDQPTVSAGTPKTTYVYDTATGNETQQIDANGHVTSFTYDASGNQLTRTLPNVTGQSTAIEHTFYGTFNGTNTRVTETVDFDGNKADYQYDTLGRVSEIDYTRAGQTSPQEKVTYHYDALGRQSEVDDSLIAVGNTSYAYDADGHVTQVISPQGVVNPSARRTWIS
jgi:YD repeat-containing protein